MQLFLRMVKDGAVEMTNQVCLRLFCSFGFMIGWLVIGY